MQENQNQETGGNLFARALDENLAQLGETDRNALLLRFGEGRNHREVGAALGLTEEAAKKRVNRALERLRVALLQCEARNNTASADQIRSGFCQVSISKTGCSCDRDS